MPVRIGHHIPSPSNISQALIYYNNYAQRYGKEQKMITQVVDEDIYHSLSAHHVVYILNEEDLAVIQDKEKNTYRIVQLAPLPTHLENTLENISSKEVRYTTKAKLIQLDTSHKLTQLQQEI